MRIYDLFNGKNKYSYIGLMKNIDEEITGFGLVPGLFSKNFIVSTHKGELLMGLTKTGQII